jgi:hypothetical protein
LVREKNEAKKKRARGNRVFQNERRDDGKRRDRCPGKKRGQFRPQKPDELKKNRRAPPESWSRCAQFMAL